MSTNTDPAFSLAPITALDNIADTIVDVGRASVDALNGIRRSIDALTTAVEDLTAATQEDR